MDKTLHEIVNEIEKRERKGEILRDDEENLDDENTVILSYS